MGYVFKIKRRHGRRNATPIYGVVFRFFSEVTLRVLDTPQDEEGESAS